MHVRSPFNCIVCQLVALVCVFKLFLKKKKTTTTTKNYSNVIDRRQTRHEKYMKMNREH